MHDFYELGGNSFNAIRIINEIEKELKIKLSIKDIMNNSKVYSLSNICSEIMKYNYNNYKIEIIENTHEKEYPLSYLFNNILYNIKQDDDIDESNMMSDQNIIIYYKILKDLDIEKLSYAFNAIINRHKILKSQFIVKNINGNKMIYGKIRDDMTLKIENFNRNNYKQIYNSIDISKEDLIRVGIIEDKILVIRISHIICDGFSYGILINDLINIYNDEILEELPYQFSDYAIYYDKKLNSNDAFSDQIQYYKSIFDTPHPCGLLNKSKKLLDGNHQGERMIHFKIIGKLYDKETFKNIKEIIKKENISETTYFLVIISLVLSIYSEQESILTCLTNSSRNNYYAEKLIGMFATKIPLLVKIEDMSLISLIQKYKNILLTILSYDVPIKKLVEELNIKSINMEFQYDPYELEGSNDSDPSKCLKLLTKNELCTMLEEKDDNSSSEYDNYDEKDIKFSISEMENSYYLNVSYDKDLYEEDLIHSIINDITLIIENNDYLYKNINYIKECINN